MRSPTPLQTLRAAIRLSLRVEEEAQSIDVDTPRQFIAIGFLIRNRRIAQAIVRLGTSHAYEGRMLLRTMVEIMINHAWIRLKWTKSRALRYVAFHPLELLRASEHEQQLVPSSQIADIQRNLRRERAKVRHLFRTKDKKGRYTWASSWAKCGNVKERLRQVLTHRRPLSANMRETLTPPEFNVEGGVRK